MSADKVNRVFDAMDGLVESKQDSGYLDGPVLTHMRKVITDAKGYNYAREERSESKLQKAIEKRIRKQQKNKSNV